MIVLKIFHYVSTLFFLNSETNVTLLVSMVGGDNVKPTEVSLVEASSSNSLNGTLEEVASGQYLVTFNSIPTGEFTVRVVGQISSSRSSDNTFQRQSPTQFQASNVTITVSLYSKMFLNKSSSCQLINQHLQKTMRSTQ